LIHVAIVAGGSGTRFWPKSRANLPKQFLRFGAGAPLLAETFARTRLVAPAARTWVVTAAAHVARVRELLPELPADQVVGEPAARDTAPAVGLAATLIAARDPDAVVLICPADHRIVPSERFAAAARAAEELLARHPDRIVVFGIRPTGPATGYGYVEQGAPLGDFARLPVFDVTAFHEKPPEAKAREYVASGRFLWNAGLFAFRARTLLDELARQMPKLRAGLDELAQSIGTSRFGAELARLFPTFERKSLDHGVMERARARAVVVPDYAWDDVGSFLALARGQPPDADGNVVVGAGLALDAHGNVVDAGDGLVALIGVEDLVVVHTGDVTLVCRRDRCEDVKKLIELARARGFDRHL
jgi:mannose-1-phosphate guanylyltransferase